MTAKSELFVDENIRDEVEKILQKREILKENEGISIEVPKEWRGIWSATDFPSSGKARILDSETDEPIGEVEWDVDFVIEEDMGGRYIEAEPIIRRIVWKGNEVYCKFKNGNLKIFEVAEDEKCGGCNWKVHKLYLLASSEEEAKELYNEHGGLCADCLVELLIEMLDSENIIIKEN